MAPKYYQCKLCGSDFDGEQHQPRLLPCNHHCICNKCLHDTTDSQSQACPTCRHSWRSANVLPVVYTLIAHSNKTNRTAVGGDDEMKGSFAGSVPRCATTVAEAAARADALSLQRSSLPDCDVCSDHFNGYERKPLLLPCGHCFCHNCLQALENNGDKKCPQCREPWDTTMVANLPSVLSLVPEGQVGHRRRGTKILPTAAPVGNKMQTGEPSAGKYDYPMMAPAGGATGITKAKDPMEKTKQIFVTDTRNKTITLDVTFNETVEELRRLIQHHLGIAPDQQSLLFNGTYLQNGRTLESYNMKANQSIRLTCRLAGGSRRLPL